MDKCPVCGHVESTQELVNSQAMNRFVRTKDKAVGIFNNASERFTVPVKTGKQDADGIDIVERIEWVREDVYAKIPVAKPADKSEGEKKPIGGLTLG